MKTIRYALFALLACLTLGSCQEVEEPTNTVPTVSTDKTEEYGGSYAFLSGTVSDKGNYYFLLSTSGDLNDARRIDAYGSLREDGKWHCVAEVGDLAPGTTYYYALCATDGRSEVRGTVQTFTTDKYLGIAAVEAYSWDAGETIGFTPEDAIGVFTATTTENNGLSIRQPSNMETYYKSNIWTLPYNIELTETPFKVYAYYPFSKEYAEFTIPVDLSNGKPYLYGCSEDVSKSNTDAHIVMKHALARVTFSVTKSADSNFSEYVTMARLYGEPAVTHTGAIALYGKMNVFTGAITPIYDSNDGIFRYCEFAPDTEKENIIEMWVIPTSFNDGEVTFELTMGDQIIYAGIPAEKWESGMSYNYPFELTLSGLQLGNVRVEEWENNNGGSIIINQ